MSYSILATALADVLESVKTAPGSLLTQYFLHEEPASSPLITAFPYAQLIVKQSEETPLDTTTNNARYDFVIRVISIHEKRAVLEQTMMSVADALLAELRKKTNQTLDGAAYKFFPFVVSWGFESANGSAPLRYFDLEVSAETLHNIV